MRVLADIEDLALDTPGVAGAVGNFVGRAIADEVLPPAFLQAVPEVLISEGLGREVAARVRSLVGHSHVGLRLSNVWTSSSGKTVLELKDSIRQLTEELLQSGDVEEAESPGRLMESGKATSPGLPYLHRRAAIA